MTGAGEPEFRVRALTSSVYVPNLLFSIGQGAMIPIVALLALDLGASPAVAGLIVALRGVGTMVFDVPAGALVARIGEKRAMVFAGLALGAISAAIWLRPSLLVYAVLVTLAGCAWALWLLARIAFAAGATPLPYRGRVMAMIGGVNRIGLLIGPLIGSLVIDRGDLVDPFLVMAVLSGAAAGAMALARAPAITKEPNPVGPNATSTMQVLRENRQILMTAGSVAVVAQVLRSSREALLPLWADQIGIAAATVPILFAASALIQSLIFYPVGMLMDRRGRKSTMLPAIGLLSVGIAAIPLTSDLTGLTVVALLLGLANGLGAGMNMTLGSDLSPLTGRSRFLGVWRLVSDSGNVGGPLIVAAATSILTLGTAAVLIATIGGAGTLVLWRLVPETLDPLDST